MIKYFENRQERIVRQAIKLLEKDLSKNALKADCSSKVKDFCILKLHGLEHEIFSVLYLNSQHELIEYQELFRGSLAECGVYPREIAKEALKLNAGAVILAHNHPSGNPEPSVSDAKITRRTAEALELLGIRTLDHIVCGATETVSFSERGLL